MGGGGPAPAAVPVEVAAIERRSVSSFLETNGSLEAENDVQIVARIQGPVVELAAEEGMRLKKGDLMLKIDETETLAQVEIAKVGLKDATRAHERAQSARDSEIISLEVYDAALAQLESAEAQLMNAEISFNYTSVKAPFDGIVVDRLVKLAENVTANQELFRFTEFDPLLCKIQVPEKELSRLRKGQTAYINVEAWPGERFQSTVLRISPVVDATTGTIRVTLQVRARGKLSPGMFARVFLVTDTHENAVVMPKRALSIESLSDTVFVVNDEGQAVRRDIELGYEETELVEVLSGLEVGERVIVVGQDGLTDGTPIQVLKGPGADKAPSPSRASNFEQPPGPGGRMDLSKATPEQLERVKKRMRERGMTDEQITQALARRRQQQ
jgi:RND family efflux transporter MFP subunit